MSVSSVDLEMQSPAHPLPTAAGSDDEEDLQCWRDVKAETGFSSYKSFLGLLPETGPQIEALLANIRRHASCIKFGEVHVLDILENGGLSISMHLEGRSESTEVSHREERDSNVANELKDCTQLLRNLRSPRENSRARVIVWSIPQVSSLHSGPVAAIGLGLKIQPAIFATLLSIVQNPSRVISRMESDSVIIGNSIATVARNYIPNVGAPPVLFVAKVHHRETTLSGLSQADLVPNSYGYLNLLSRYVQKGAGVDAQSDSQLLNAILPLLHLEVLDLHTQCEITQDALLKAQEETSDLHKQLAYQSLDKRRFGLRRMLEGLEKSKICFVKFARLHDPAEWLKGQPWISQKEEIIETINTARAEEAEARDYMQLQIGNLSILESRKSIQLSNQQISEAKRVKIFTILAFIYVPINLATSVFGMNLQELNQSGQDIWSFLITVIVALLITGFVWLSLEVYHVVVEHKQHKQSAENRSGEPKSMIGVRVAIRLGLIKEEDLKILRQLDNMQTKGQPH